MRPTVAFDNSTDGPRPWIPASRRKDGGWCCLLYLFREGVSTPPPPLWIPAFAGMTRGGAGGGGGRRGGGAGLAIQVRGMLRSRIKYWNLWDVRLLGVGSGKYGFHSGTVDAGEPLKELLHGGAVL